MSSYRFSLPQLFSLWDVYVLIISYFLLKTWKYPHTSHCVWREVLLWAHWKIVYHHLWRDLWLDLREVLSWKMNGSVFFCSVCLVSFWVEVGFLARSYSLYLGSEWRLLCLFVFIVWSLTVFSSGLVYSVVSRARWGAMICTRGGQK